MFKTFVINLDKDTERMEFMKDQLTSLGISFERQSAIDGRNYVTQPHEYDETMAIKEGGHALRQGELGCAISHAHVITRIITDKIPYALVLEDDVLLPKNFKSIIETQISKNKGWEYLLFDYPPVGWSFLLLWFAGVKKNFSTRKTLMQKSVFLISHIVKACYIVPLSGVEYIRDKARKYAPGPVVFFRPVYYAGAYLVTNKGAQKLHELSRPVRYTSDHLPNRARVLKKLQFRCYAPLVVMQKRETFGSSILDLSAAELKKILPYTH